MRGFIEGEARIQATLLPEILDDYITEDNAVRVIDVFIDSIDLSSMGFKMAPKDTGRPAYHPATMLELYVYGYLNRMQSTRCLEREAIRFGFVHRLNGKYVSAETLKRRREQKKCKNRILAGFEMINAVRLLQKTIWFFMSKQVYNFL